MVSGLNKVPIETCFFFFLIYMVLVVLTNVIFCSGAFVWFGRGAVCFLEVCFLALQF